MDYLTGLDSNGEVATRLFTCDCNGCKGECKGCIGTCSGCSGSCTSCSGGFIL